jgi:thiaminase
MIGWLLIVITLTRHSLTFGNLNRLDELSQWFAKVSVTERMFWT